MIINNRPESTILGALEKSVFKFYLTGSRFFGGFTPNSDWDYFVQDEPDVREYLNSLGFHSDPNQDLLGYDDSTIVSVWQLNDIHMQLVVNADFKFEVQTYLSRMTNMRAIPKTARKHLWNLAIKVVNEKNQAEAKQLEFHDRY